jgi:hypothetical protein
VRALGVIRVRGGEIVSYDDYMDPLAITKIFGRTDDLIAALQASLTISGPQREAR